MQVVLSNNDGALLVPLLAKVAHVENLNPASGGPRRGAIRNRARDLGGVGGIRNVETVEQRSSRARVP